MANSFENWFSRQLQVTRYPVPGEILKLPKASHVINVSDEWIDSCHAAAVGQQVFYHWFPLNESIGELGINSIYGALQILHYAEQRGSRVLLHCHAGAYRSPLVAQAYYYLRTGRHLHQPADVGHLDTWLCVSASDIVTHPENTLLNAIQASLLHPNIEQFLTLYAAKLEELPMTSRGGLLTLLKAETGIV